MIDQPQPDRWWLPLAIVVGLIMAGIFALIFAFVLEVLRSVR